MEGSTENYLRVVGRLQDVRDMMSNIWMAGFRECIQYRFMLVGRASITDRRLSMSELVPSLAPCGSKEASLHGGKGNRSPCDRRARLRLVAFAKPALRNASRRGICTGSFRHFAEMDAVQVSFGAASVCSA